MAYSSIIQKKCRCGCNLWPTTGYAGYNSQCRPDLVEKKMNEQKERQKKVTASRNSESKLRGTVANSDFNREKGKEYNVLDSWFRERRKEMTGVCVECGKTTSKGNDKYYKWSVCHIVPKSLIPSVATNEFNWIELCQQHHQEFDNTFDKAAAMMCFGEVKQKFQLFVHLIPNEEMRKVNPHLLSRIY